MSYYLQALSQGLRNKIKTLQKDSAMDVYPFVKKVSEIKHIDKNRRIILIDKNFPIVQRKTYSRCKDTVMIYLCVKYFF